MRVLDRETGVVLVSDDEFVIGQWRKYPDKYQEVKAQETVAAVETPPLPAPAPKPTATPKATPGRKKTQ